MEKRHTVEELKSYAAQMKDYRCDAICASINMIVWYALLTIGVYGVHELARMDSSAGIPYVSLSIDGAFVGLTSKTVIKSSKEFLKAMREKNKLKKKIDKINDELDSLEEQEGNLAKVLR